MPARSPTVRGRRHPQDQRDERNGREDGNRLLEEEADDEAGRTEHDKFVRTAFSFPLSEEAEEE